MDVNHVISGLVAQFAENLRAARAERGWSRPQLARMSGVAARAIETYERAESEPSLENAALLARALRVSLDALAGMPTRQVESAQPPASHPKRRAADVDAPELVRQIEENLAALRQLLGGLEPGDQERSG